MALPDVWDGEGEVGYDDFSYPQGQEEGILRIGEETRKKEGQWVVLWRASVRGMIVVEERERERRREREEGEGRGVGLGEVGEVEGGSGSGSVGTPDFGGGGEVLDGDGGTRGCLLRGG